MIKGITLTVILTVIIILFYIMDFYFLSRHDTERKKEGKGWAWDYTLFTMAMGAMVLLQPIFLPALGWSVDTAWGIGVQALGGVSVLLSFILHIWSRLHLRHFYTERVEIQPEHKVIDTGPYAFVRHPLITSFLLLASGIFLLNPAVTTLLIVIYGIWTFTSSAKEEEKALSANVPGYTDYLKRTPRFLPRLWKN